MGRAAAARPNVSFQPIDPAFAPGPRILASEAGVAGKRVPDNAKHEIDVTRAGESID
jgi:hypothetical protein